MSARIPELLKENSLVGAAIVSPQGSFLEVNRRLCEFLGYEEQQLLQLTFKEISHPDDLLPDVNPYRLVESGEMKSFMLRKRYKHGQTGEWLEAILQTEGFYGDDGQFLYYFSQVGLASASDLSAAEANQLIQIKQAIASDSFVLHYQPIVSLETGEIQGYEALARWQDGTRLITPGIFLPLLRKGQCEHLLCHWVIQKAAEVQGILSESGQWLSFNVAPSTIARDDWAADLLPAGAHMEVLEQDGGQIQPQLQEARRRGVKIALDDFGTGFCSYDRLLTNEVDLVKIDRSLIKSLPGQRATVVVRTLVGLCRSLGIETIAEGVENVDQANALAEIGCDMAQGYLYGRPAPQLGLRSID